MIRIITRYGIGKSEALNSGMTPINCSKGLNGTFKSKSNFISATLTRSKQSERDVSLNTPHPMKCWAYLISLVSSGKGRTTTKMQHHRNNNAGPTVSLRYT